MPEGAAAYGRGAMPASPPENKHARYEDKSPVGRRDFEPGAGQDAAARHQARPDKRLGRQQRQRGPAIRLRA